MNPEDFLAAVRLHCTMLPEYMPMKWGWSEPLKYTFDPEHLERLVDNRMCDNVWWKRTGPQNANGSWMKRWKSGVDHLGDTHASVAVSVYDTVFQQKLLIYLKAASQCSDADIGFLDSITEPYFDFAIESQLIKWVSKSNPSSWHILLTTHTLRHWLPDIPWAVVFGPAYVRMFGKEKLLSTPAYRVEDMGPEMVFIQLTPKLEDIHDQYEMVMAARTQVKLHLGNDAFFKPELAYDYKDEANKSKAGKVFRVPLFELNPD